MKTPRVVLGMKIRARLDDRDVRARLAKLPAEVARDVLLPALKAGGDVLADGVRKRLPVDTGTARDAVRVKAYVGRDGRGSANVDYDVAAIKANAPNGEFYPAILEYGAEGRPPVAPLRRTLEQDGKAAADAVADEARRRLESMGG